MGIADDVREWWLRRDEFRVEEWRRDQTFSAAFLNAVYELTAARPTALRSPVGAVRVAPDWLPGAAVAEFDADDDFRLVVRLLDRDPIELELHAVGHCRACHATVPLDPPVETSDELAAALEYERPAEHACLKHPPTGTGTDRSGEV